MDYKFRDEALEQTALTHKSFGKPHNERLEWLGDSLLSAAVSEILWRRFPSLSEGTLTEMRISLVRNETLAGAALRAGFAERIRLGRGEIRGKRGKKLDKKSILAAAFEAYVAAVKLDGGDPAAAAAWLLSEEIEAAARILKEGPANAFRPAKTRLQELMQRHGRPLPEYLSWEFKRRRGLPHFRVDCTVEGQVFQGFGKSIRRAGDDAAKKALAALEGGDESADADDSGDNSFADDSGGW